MTGVLTGLIFILIYVTIYLAYITIGSCIFLILNKFMNIFRFVFIKMIFDTEIVPFIIVMVVWPLYLISVFILILIEYSINLYKLLKRKN